MKNEILIRILTPCLLIACVFILAGCFNTPDADPNLFSEDEVISETREFSGDVTVAEGVTVTLEDGVMLFLDADSTLHVRGTLKLTEYDFATLNYIGAEKIAFYKGANLYVNDKHVLGEEGDFSAIIQLGNTTWAARQSGAPVLTLTTGKVSIAGKVYLNGEIKDSRPWDLGDDSAVVLYEDNSLKFISDEGSLACVHTAGGQNTHKDCTFDKRHTTYFVGDEGWTGYSWLDFLDMSNILPEGFDEMTPEEQQNAIYNEVLPKLGGYLDYTEIVKKRNADAMGGAPTWNGKEVTTELEADASVGEDGQLIKNVRFSEREGTRNVYDLWLPASVANGEDKGRDVPVIVFLHGGSWTSGVKEDISDLCAMYAKMGYVTATVNYRLNLEEGAEGFVYEYDNGDFFDMMKDIEDTVKSIKSELEKRGYTSSGMAISGQSAGGHLAMLYAANYGDESAIPVKLVLDEYGPADFSPTAWANAKVIWGADPDRWDEWGKTYKTISDDPAYDEKMENSAAFVAGMLLIHGYDVELEADGKTPTDAYIQKLLRDYNGPTSEIYKQIQSLSPVLNWEKYNIPLVGIHGEMDPIVNVENAFALDRMLESLNTDYMMIITPVNGHPQGEDKNAYEAYYAASLEYLERYLPSAK